MSSENHSIQLDAGNLSVTFAVRWLGAVTVRGRFTQATGTVRIPDGCLDQAEVSIDVVAASLQTGIGLRDRHLRGPQFLDAERHPLITFRSTKVHRPNGVLIVSGLLSLRGLERQIRARCPIDHAGDAGASPVRVSARFTVPRLPHGIGVARGIERLNPLLYAIGSDVVIHADVLVPANELLPALLPALGR
jgi:polyisoprenoid-binding protein YceI